MQVNRCEGVIAKLQRIQLRDNSGTAAPRLMGAFIIKMLHIIFEFKYSKA